jgi:spore germination protein YaaH
VNWGGWDLPGLAASCDGIFIMGYAFWGSWSSTSGPNAPLTGGTYNITNTVLTQYGTVTQNNPEKLILGVPYYGHHWTTTSSGARSSVISFQGSTRFFDDEPDSQVYGLLWEGQSQTPWYRWKQGSTWHQVWFDNATSLGLKYDLAIDNNLQGVGMWALGYDGARPELWDLLEQKYGGCGYCCDYTGDGHVTADDWTSFQFCMYGPGTEYLPGHFCLDGDAEEDMDVDMADFAQFQVGFGH